MNLEEEIKEYRILHIGRALEQAFKAGAEYIRERAYPDGPEDDIYVQFPTIGETELACTKYINGNFKYGQS